MMWNTENKRLLWRHLITMIIDKIPKMTVKGVKLKSESFFSIFHDILELWRKNLKGSAPPGMDRAKDPPGLNRVNVLLQIFYS